MRSPYGLTASICVPSPANVEVHKRSPVAASRAWVRGAPVWRVLPPVMNTTVPSGLTPMDRAAPGVSQPPIRTQSTWPSTAEYAMTRNRPDVAPETNTWDPSGLTAMERGTVPYGLGVRKSDLRGRDTAPGRT